MPENVGASIRGNGQRGAYRKGYRARFRAQTNPSITAASNPYPDDGQRSQFYLRWLRGWEAADLYIRQRQGGE